MYQKFVLSALFIFDVVIMTSLPRPNVTNLTLI
jgi:hypothetical protein